MVCIQLAKRFGQELGESRENSNCKLDQIPKVHEGEPEKQSQGSPKLGDQGLHGVDESLGLHEQVGRGVLQKQLGLRIVLLR